MDWAYPKTRRRGPEWKQGWTEKTLSSISTPSLHLLAIFSIVTILLWFSQFTNCKSNFRQSMINLQVFIILVPVLMALCMVLYDGIGRFNYMMRATPHHHHEVEESTVNLHGKRQSGGGGGGLLPPWLGVGVLVVVLLVLLSYQPSFQSRWFGNFRR